MLALFSSRFLFFCQVKADSFYELFLEITLIEVRRNIKLLLVRAPLGILTEGNLVSGSLDVACREDRHVLYIHWNALQPETSEPFS